jgi:hypothetical protein
LGNGGHGSNAPRGQRNILSEIPDFFFLILSINYQLSIDVRSRISGGAVVQSADFNSKDESQEEVNQ